MCFLSIFFTERIYNKILNKIIEKNGFCLFERNKAVLIMIQIGDTITPDMSMCSYMSSFWPQLICHEGYVTFFQEFESCKA
jgi:hypothetical protein